MTRHLTPPPPELAIRLDPGVRRLAGHQGATVLLGGSPLRLLRLDVRAASVFEQLAAGAPLAAITGASQSAVGGLARRLLDSGLAHPVWALDAHEDAQRGLDPNSVTVVIPVKDRAAELTRLLPSLGVAPRQIIVVDDGSHDASGEVARTFGATVIRNAEATGPAAARNRGLQHVTTPYVAFMDSDCEATGNWLAALIVHLRDPEVALVAPRIVSPAGPGALTRYLAIRSPLDLGPSEAPVRARSRVAYVPAAALVGRTDVLRGLGGFDERLRVGEDVDLVWRVADAGHSVRYEPRALVMHHDPASVRAVLARHRSYGSSAATLADRHPGKVPPLAVSAWSMAAWAGIATQHAAGIAVGAGVAAISSALLPRKLAMLAQPTSAALTLAGRGHLGAGRLIANAITRTWWPIAIPVALVSRRARRVLLAAVVVPALLEWRQHRRDGRTPPDPFTYLALRTADDAAYCAGVWQGAWRARSGRALVPDLTSWPGRTGARTRRNTPAGATPHPDTAKMPG